MAVYSDFHFLVPEHRSKMLDTEQQSRSREVRKVPDLGAGWNI